MKFSFICGGLRSGGTLLGNLLAQNPKVHVSPTNDLSVLFAQAARSWSTYENFRAQGLARVKPKMKNALIGMLEGFYKDVGADMVFDCSRDWMSVPHLLEEVFEGSVNLVVPVRDPRDVCASFEKLFRENQLTKPALPLMTQIETATVLMRCQKYLAYDTAYGMWFNWFKDAIETGLGHKLIIVPYRQLIREPRGVIFAIHEALGLEPFVCDPEQVENTTHDVEREFDVYGIPYHDIRPVVDNTADGRGQLLPSDARQWLEENFSDLIKLAEGPLIIRGVPYATEATTDISP